MKALLPFLLLISAVFPVLCQEPEPEPKPGPEQEQEKQQQEETGPVLTIDDCIMMAVLYNREIRESYLDLKKTEHDIFIDRSQFLPEIDLKYEHSDEDYDSTGTDTLDDSLSLTYSQRLLEFGREADDLTATRAAIRSSLYNLKQGITSVISDVRSDFFYIILKQQQMAERKVLLKEFKENLLIAKAKYAKGQILEVDVFTSELNVLNEELRINEINRAILKRKMDLRYRLGCCIPLKFGLVGERIPLNLDEKQALDSAVAQSYYLENLQEEIREKEREIAEKKWEYLPQLTFQMGVENYRNVVSVDLSQSSYVWGVDVEAESYIDPPASRETLFPTDDMRDVFFKFQVKLPLFDGFKKREEQAKERKDLRILRVQYMSMLDDLKRDVLKDYQDYYEQKERLLIVQRRVEIAKRRFEINEKLKEFGKIDDNQLETFRNAFFSQQDQLYAGQDSLIQAEEDIRSYLFDAEKHIRILDSPGKYKTELRMKYPFIRRDDDETQ